MMATSRDLEAERAESERQQVDEALADEYQAAWRARQAAEIAHEGATAAARRAAERYQAARTELSEAHDACLRGEAALPRAGGQPSATDRQRAARVVLAAAQTELESARAAQRASAKAVAAARAALLPLEDRWLRGEMIEAGIYQDAAGARYWLVVTASASRRDPVPVTQVHRGTHRVVARAERAAHTLHHADGLDDEARARIMASVACPWLHAGR